MTISAGGVKIIAERALRNISQWGDAFAQTIADRLQSASGRQRVRWSAPAGSVGFRLGNNGMSPIVEEQCAAVGGLDLAELRDAAP
jgi:hypothetical protein